MRSPGIRQCPVGAKGSITTHTTGRRAGATRPRARPWDPSLSADPAPTSGGISVRPGSVGPRQAAGPSALQEVRRACTSSRTRRSRPNSRTESSHTARARRSRPNSHRPSPGSRSCWRRRTPCPRGTGNRIPKYRPGWAVRAAPVEGKVTIGMLTLAGLLALRGVGGSVRRKTAQDRRSPHDGSHQAEVSEHLPPGDSPIPQVLFRCSHRVLLGLGGAPTG